MRTCITPATSLAEPPPAGRGDNAKLDLTYVAIESLTAYAGNPRKHPKKQIDKLVASIAAFGLVQPLIVDAAGVIVGGHAVCGTWPSAPACWLACRWCASSISTRVAIRKKAAPRLEQARRRV